MLDEDALTGGERVLAAALIVAAALAKLAHQQAPSECLDGAYYFQIARHVAEGDGLQTSVSVFHTGLRSLPQAISTYPLWPLVLGMVGRVVGIARAAPVVTEGLYVLDVALTYLLVERLARRLLADGGRFHRRVPVTIAHVAAAALASNPIFFWATSLPYTEALAFALILATLWAVDAACVAAAAPRRLHLAVSAGVLAGFAYLTRFQMIVVPVAAVATFLACLRGRSRWHAALACAGGALLAMVPEMVHLSRFEHFTPAMLIDHAAYRQTPEVAPMRHLVEPATALDWLLDRATGVAVAFDPTREVSFFDSFGAAAAAPLVVAVVWLARPAARHRAVATLASSGSGGVTFALLAGFLLVAPLCLLHSMYWKEWTFGWRQGLPFVLLVVPCLAHLAASGNILRWAAVALAALGIAHGVSRSVERAQPGPREDYTLFVAARWLDAQPGRVTAMAIEPQPLSVHTRRGLYWSACWTPPEVVRTMLDQLRIDYLLLRPHERVCPSMRPLMPELELVEKLDRGVFSVYRRKRSP